MLKFLSLKGEIKTNLQYIQTTRGNKNKRDLWCQVVAYASSEKERKQKQFDL